MNELLELKGITAGYEQTVVLRDVNLTIREHDFIGIIGPNGCGKSTLMKIITGKIEPDHGDVEIGDTIQIGYFAQEAEAMDPKQRVIDYMKDTAEYVPTKDGRITVSQMLERFLFDPVMQYTPIGKLSGGEKKLASLGTILAIDPKCILLDEPTTGLDPRNRKVLINIIKNLDKTKIITTHDLDMAMEICQRVIILSNGKIVADGNPHDILLNEDIMLNNGLELPLGKY